MKTTRENLIKIYEELPILKDLEGFKFQYAVSRNKIKLEKEVNILREMIKPDEEYLKFDKEVLELKNKFAEKDEKGNPKIITQGRMQYFDIKNPEFATEYDILKEKYKEAIENRESQAKKFEEFIKEEIDFEFFYTDEKDVPLNANGTQTDLIMNFLKE